jgi:hypothetical protein
MDIVVRLIKELLIYNPPFTEWFKTTVESEIMAFPY